MALMALPPVTPVIESASPAEQTSSRPILRESYWRDIAFSRIDSLIEEGRLVSGFGDFRPTEQAAGRLRLELNAMAIDSLPSPVIAPISGGGLMARWRSGARSVEITVYHDGEVVRDAMESDVTSEQISELDPSRMLLWMSGRLVFVNAPA